MERRTPPPAETQRSTGWRSATVRALVVLAASFLALAILPDRLLTWLSTAVSPAVRDLIVVLCFGAAFVFVSWLFVRLQRGPRA